MNQKMQNKFMNKELKKENIPDKNLNNLNQRNVSVVVKLEYLNQKIIYVNQVIVNFIIIQLKQKMYQIYKHLVKRKLMIYFKKYVKQRIHKQNFKNGLIKL